MISLRLPNRPWRRDLRRETGIRTPTAIASTTIREFIAKECPIAGFDGRFRERPRDSDVEAAVLTFNAEHILVPGSTALLRAPEHTLEQVIQDEGQVLLCVVQPQDALMPLQPPKGGSYSSLAQCHGFQRLSAGQGGYIRVVCQQRVLVQALRGDPQSGHRAQAAVLQDRWAYFVRAQVVEEVLDAAIAAGGGISRASLETLNLSGQPAEVRSAVASLQDVAQQMQAEVAEIQDMLVNVQRRQQSSPEADSSQVDEVLDELARIVQFVEWSQGGDVQPFAALQRLSYAMFAAELLASYSGMPMGEVVTQRIRAFENMDLGMRLEEGLEFTREISSRMAARSAMTS